MPRHYSLGVNVKSGTLTFDNTTTGVVEFEEPFFRKPSITLTLEDNAASTPPYKIKPRLGWKNGFVVRFQEAYTGSIDWQAME